MPKLIRKGDRSKEALIVGRNGDCKRCGASVRFTVTDAIAASGPREDGGYGDQRFPSAFYRVEWRCPDPLCGEPNRTDFVIPTASMYYEGH